MHMSHWFRPSGESSKIVLAFDRELAAGMTCGTLPAVVLFKELDGLETATRTGNTHQPNGHAELQRHSRQFVASGEVYDGFLESVEYGFHEVSMPESV